MKEEIYCSHPYRRTPCIAPILLLNLSLTPSFDMWLCRRRKKVFPGYFRKQHRALVNELITQGKHLSSEAIGCFVLLYRSYALDKAGLSLFYFNGNAPFLQKFKLKFALLAHYLFIKWDQLQRSTYIYPISLCSCIVSQ